MYFRGSSLNAIGHPRNDKDTTLTGFQQALNGKYILSIFDMTNIDEYYDVSPMNPGNGN